LSIFILVFSVIYISAFSVEENTLEQEEPMTEEIVSEKTPLIIESEDKNEEVSDLKRNKDLNKLNNDKLKTDSSLSLLDQVQNSEIFNKIQEKATSLGQNVFDSVTQKILTPKNNAKVNTVEVKKETSNKNIFQKTVHKLSNNMEKNRKVIYK
jgi:hypothetical protein